MKIADLPEGLSSQLQINHPATLEFSKSGEKYEGNALFMAIHGLGEPECTGQFTFPASEAASPSLLGANAQLTVSAGRDYSFVVKINKVLWYQGDQSAILRFWAEF